MDDEWDDLREKVYHGIWPEEWSLPSGKVYHGMSLPSGLAGRMMAEIERLQRNLKLANESCGEWADENERLRAALDEIESYGGAQGLIAREALKDD